MTNRVSGSGWERRHSLLTATVACLVLFAPLILFLIHGRGHPTENRASAEFTGLSQGWHSVGAFGDFVADRMPLRAAAVRLDGRVDEYVFNEDPAFGGSASPRVIRGADGFLFLADAIDNACAPAAPPEASATSLSELARLISESGRDLVTMVAPDKSTIHPELMPPDFAKRECFEAYTADLWTDLDTARIEGFVNLRRSLQKVSQSSREPLYLRKDSHWDSAGSLVALRATIDHFAPGLWNEAEVEYQGLGRYTGDLTGLQGHPSEDDAPMYSVVRPDVTSVSVQAIDDLEGGFNRRFINTAPPGRLVPGRTVMFLDSFGMVALPQIAPFFEDLTVVRLVDYEPTKFLDLIQVADRVWIMSVERSLAHRLEFEIGSKAFRDMLNTQLQQIN